MSCECRTAELLDMLQNGTYGGKGGTADQSTYGRMRLGIVFRENISRIKNVLIESCGGKKNYIFGLRRTVFTEKFL